MLPTHIKLKAKRRFERLQSMPAHPSLNLKKAGKYWTVRVDFRYRAIGVDVADGILWFWIGAHAEYDKRLSGTGSDSLREALGAWIVDEYHHIQTLGRR